LKLSGVFLLLPLTLSAFQQPLPPQALQHGVRVGSQTAVLFEDEHAPAPPNSCTLIETVGGRTVFVLNGSGGQGLILAQGGDLASLSVDKTAPCIQFDTWVEQLPENYAESVISGFASTVRGSSKTSFERYIRDNLRLVYVSYKVTVERSPDGAYRVAFSAPTSPAPTDLRPRGDWKMVSPAQYPVPQIVHDDDEVRVLLYTDPKGVEMVDYLHVGRVDKMAKRKDAARDAYALDSEFSLAKPAVSVNGTPLEAAPLPDTLRGGIVWVYAPGYGRYVLAFAPHPGMARAGEVSGNLLTFSLDGDIIRLACADRIAAGGGIYNVYAVRDESWQPADPKDREKFMIGTSPGVETAVRPASE